ncbi:MAG TPA: PKD domain-containing protein [Chitinispirillaceae bacterium]|nr:PKD domain-containing protein [Chitinispirillaceae bacterium]
MKVMLRNVIFSILSIMLLFSGCAQRDNRFDPSSPLYVELPPVLKVSCSFGLTQVLKSISDSEFVVRPYTRVSFKAGGYEADSDKPLPVLIKTVHNGEIKNIKQNVTEMEVDLGDSGRTEIIFETIDETRLCAEKKYIFDILPYKKPLIISFKTESDTIKVGRTVDAMFIFEISDPDTVLDSVKFNWGVSTILTKGIKNSGTLYSDSTSIQLVSNTASTTPMQLIAVDKMGRSDTCSIMIVSNSRGKTGNLVPPSIEKIDIQKQGPDTNVICFHPVVTVYNGDISKVGYTWSFGGDNISTESNPCKKFSIPGTYNVILTIEDQEGAITTDSVEVVIPVLQKKPLEIYKLISTPDSGYAPLDVHFQLVLPAEADTEDVLSVLWRFGDGSQRSGELQENYKYMWPGNYYIMVILSSNGGFDTIYHVIHAFSNIRYSPMTPVAGQKISFWISGGLNRQNVKVFWMFPDTQFFAKPNDTCYVALQIPTEVKVDVFPEGGEWFNPYRLGSLLIWLLPGDGRGGFY